MVAACGRRRRGRPASACGGARRGCRQYSEPASRSRQTTQSWRRARNVAHIAGFARAAPALRRGSRSSPSGHSDRADAEASGTVPPLSWTLRDSPRSRGRAAAGAYSFGERTRSGPLLSRAPLRLRSFCLRVSGAVAPSAPRLWRDLSRGRAISASRVAPSARYANPFRIKHRISDRPGFLVSP